MPGPGAAGSPRLIAAGRVRRDHLLLSARSRARVVFEELYAAGRSSWSWCRRAPSASGCAAPPPGSAASIRRSASAPGSPKARRHREIDGRLYVLEKPLKGDVALHQGRPRRPLGQPDLPEIGAQLQPDDGDGGRTDRSSRCAEIVELGELDPEMIVTPGIFVDRVVVVGGTSMKPLMPLKRRQIAWRAAQDLPRRRLCESRDRSADAMVRRSIMPAVRRDRLPQRERRPRGRPGARPGNEDH